MSVTGKALVITASGGNEVFSLVNNHTVPAPGPGQVIIKAVASSVNPVDAYVRSGAYASKTFPKVIGGDVSGHIHAVGEGSTKFAVGDAVYALSTSFVPFAAEGFEGTYAEYVLVKEDWVSLAPKSLSLADAAGVPLVFLTALQALEKASPVKGQRVLVLGASGAVGQHGVQLAKQVFGLHVTGVSSAKHADLVKSLGADEVWDYKEGPEGLKATFSSNKFDIIFDVIGGELLDAAVTVLKSEGYITHIRNKGSGDAPDRYTKAFEDGTGHKFGATFVQPSGSGLDKATELLDSGKLVQKTALTLPLAEAGKGHDIVTDGHAGGKVILII